MCQYQTDILQGLGNPKEVWSGGTGPLQLLSQASVLLISHPSVQIGFETGSHYTVNHPNHFLPEALGIFKLSGNQKNLEHKI
ncbi:hypothetical protein [Scytonema sp. PCC 10023]|uniref:hypothetical protein n=1 Tax=Scytonema sp. PCC 10023 TaxID=1680591 RepID=UPI0039C6C493